jgi:hypothetical protein
VEVLAEVEEVKEYQLCQDSVVSVSHGVCSHGTSCMYDMCGQFHQWIRQPASLV